MGAGGALPGGLCPPKNTRAWSLLYQGLPCLFNVSDIAQGHTLGFLWCFPSQVGKRFRASYS